MRCADTTSRTPGEHHKLQSKPPKATRQFPNPEDESDFELGDIFRVHCATCIANAACITPISPSTVSGSGNHLERRTGGKLKVRKVGSERKRKRGTLIPASTSLARQPFGQAASEYVMARKLELAPASQAKESIEPGEQNRK